MNSTFLKSPRFWKGLLKWSLFALTLYFVVRYGYRQWLDLDTTKLTWSPGWLILAGTVYFLGWVPAAWLWGDLLRQAGQPVPFLPLWRAHFCGHLGKYIPGKAVSLIIRAVMLKDYRINVVLAGLLATAETLVTMATGVLLTIVLLPIVLGMGQTERLIEIIPVLDSFLKWPLSGQVALALAILAGSLALVPFATRILETLIARMDRRKAAADDRSRTVKLPVSEMYWGIATVACGWFLNACSLGIILMSLGVWPDSLLTPLWWICTVAGATSLGFLVLFAPGGLGVREAILIAMLQLSPEVDASIAVVAAVLSRIVTFISEVVFSLLLYFLPTSPPASPDE